MLANQSWVWFAIALGFVVYGFWPSFLSVLPDQTTLVLIHAISAMLWLALPILQAWLISSHRQQLHRYIGWASLVLAIVVVCSAVEMGQIMVLKNIDDFQLRKIKFVLLDLTGLALFSTFFGLAIWHASKRNIGLHLRLMACTAIIPMEAANERITMRLFPKMVPDYDTALYASLLSIEGILAALIIVEWKRDQIRWPFTFMLSYYLLIHAIATPVALNPRFQDFCLWFARL
jgi:hypothetical protein